MADATLSSTEISALARNCLVEAGYRMGDEVPAASGGRIFEDRYGTVCVGVFQTWSQLAAEWAELFGVLIETVSAAVPQADRKTWETYLVLLTPEPVPVDEYSEVARIRYDMRRARKLVATGTELRTSSDVERALRPLLPLAPVATSRSQDSSLDLLPGLVGNEQVPTDAVATAVAAFKEGRSIVSAIDEWVRAT